jgi:hypothetical protein
MYETRTKFFPNLLKILEDAKKQLMFSKILLTEVIIFILLVMMKIYLYLHVIKI